MLWRIPGEWRAGWETFGILEAKLAQYGTHNVTAILILSGHGTQRNRRLQTPRARRRRWGLGWGGSLPLGRQLHGAFLLAVSSVSTDLHEGPGESGPFIIVGYCQLSNIVDPNTAF